MRKRKKEKKLDKRTERQRDRQIERQKRQCIFKFIIMMIMITMISLDFSDFLTEPPGLAPQDFTEPDRKTTSPVKDISLKQNLFLHVEVTS